MNITLYGSTGQLGRVLLMHCLSAGHQTTTLLRRPFPDDDAHHGIKTVYGSGLDEKAVAQSLPENTDAVLFAVGMNRSSENHLCSTMTETILKTMPASARFVFCSCWSALFPGEKPSFLLRCARQYCRQTTPLLLQDKDAQLALLAHHPEVNWCGIRPMRLVSGPSQEYSRGGFGFSPFFRTTYDDCAQAMMNLLPAKGTSHEAPFIRSIKSTTH
ncbi:MAG: NAD(P)H-binding protein [Spirochaetales bacterium]|nr:NAD(P)H-binding protein [Spirochaetales bacterium]